MSFVKNLLSWNKKLGTGIFSDMTRQLSVTLYFVYCVHWIFVYHKKIYCINQSNIRSNFFTYYLHMITKDWVTCAIEFPLCVVRFFKWYDFAKEQNPPEADCYFDPWMCRNMPLYSWYFSPGAGSNCSQNIPFLLKITKKYFILSSLIRKAQYKIKNI